VPSFSLSGGERTGLGHPYPDTAAIYKLFKEKELGLDDQLNEAFRPSPKKERE